MEAIAVDRVQLLRFTRGMAIAFLVWFGSFSIAQAAFGVNPSFFFIDMAGVGNSHLAIDSVGTGTSFFTLGSGTIPLTAIEIGDAIIQNFVLILIAAGVIIATVKAQNWQVFLMAAGAGVLLYIISGMIIDVI